MAERCQIHILFGYRPFLPNQKIKTVKSPAVRIIRRGCVKIRACTVKYYIKCRIAGLNELLLPLMCRLDVLRKIFFRVNAHFVDIKFKMNMGNLRAFYYGGFTDSSYNAANFDHGAHGNSLRKLFGKVGIT